MKAIKQAYISEGIRFFRDKFAKKFNLNLIDANDTKNIEPLAIFSPCTEEDYNLYRNYKGDVTVVWCGSDAMKIDKQREGILKSRKARHIAISSFIAKDLDKLSVPYERIPISPTNIDLKPFDRGDNIYFYGAADKKKSEFYGEHYLKEIEERTGLKIIKANKNTYSYNELIEVYKTCFIGLRLTIHDGLPNTAIELGLMGRRCVHNGETPHSYSYKNVGDICDAVMKEYENRHIDDTKQVSKDWRDYVDVGNEWLYINGK